MLKDLTNHDQTTPEKCAGCGIHIKDRYELFKHYLFVIYMYIAANK